MTKKGLRKGLTLGLVLAYAMNTILPNLAITAGAQDTPGAGVIEIEVEEPNDGGFRLAEETFSEDKTFEELVDSNEAFVMVDGVQVDMDTFDEYLEEFQEEITPYSVEVIDEEAEETEVDEWATAGAFQIKGGIEGEDYTCVYNSTYLANIITILSSEVMTIKNTNAAAATTDTILVPAGVSGNIILAGVNIGMNTRSPITLTPATTNGAELHITIADGTNNYLKVTSSDSNTPSSSTSLNQYHAGIRAGEGTTLVIDDGVLNVDSQGEEVIPQLGKVGDDVILSNGTQLYSGNRLTLLDSENPGYLEVLGGLLGAGIGGMGGETGGNITINGGNIKTSNNAPTGNGSGAGIGGGIYGAGGNITINGGTIVAQGGYHAAGVGGGFCTTAAVNWLCNMSRNAVPAILNRKTATSGVVVPDGGMSGDITINGGFTTSTGGGHGNGFGDGCTQASMQQSGKKNLVLMTGGTVLANGSTTTTAAIGGFFYDLGGRQADVVITGGSLKANRFRDASVSDNAVYKTVGVAYGDEAKQTEVMMCTIDLSGYGDDLKLALVDSLDMYIDNVTKEYGLPSYTDADGKLYLWLPAPEEGVSMEVKVDTEILDDNGNQVDTDTFYAEDVAAGDDNLLKQYITQNLVDLGYAENVEAFFDGYIKGQDEEDGDVYATALNKRYNGVAEDINEVKTGITQMGIVAQGTYTEGSDPNYFTKASSLTVYSQEVDENDEEIPGIAYASDIAAEAGRYQLLVNSSEYAEEGSELAKAYWGHKFTMKSFEIEPATTEIKAVTSVVPSEEELEIAQRFSMIAVIDMLEENYDIELDRTYNAGEVVTLEAYVQASSEETEDTYEEATTCAAPEGAVQFYVDGIAYGKPVDLEVVTDDVSDSGYNYSMATISWVGFQNGYYTDYDVIEVTAEYIKDDTNYANEPTALVTTFGLSAINVDTDNDGIPDVNIDTNNDGIPDLNIDVDADGVPDVNIDTDKDGNPDVNVDVDGDRIPDINIDTDLTGEWKPSASGGNENGIWRPDTNIDANGDGVGDFNSTYPSIDNDDDGVDDNWNPGTDVEKDILGDTSSGWDDGFKYDTANPELNFDKDGDGIPDLNIDTNNDGIPDTNIDVDGDGIPDTNIDTDGDGRPDVNIDVDGDGIPDLNIDTDGTGTWKLSSEGGNNDGIWKPDTSVDTNGDGRGDYTSPYEAVDADGDGVDDNWQPGVDVGDEDNGEFAYDTRHPDINIDTNNDGTPDLNVDTNNDGIPDLNVDKDGDRIPDYNIDVDNDNKPDINIDTDGDGYPDVNLDMDGDLIPDLNIDTDFTGEWKPSSEGGNADGVWKPDTNVDLKGDGEGSYNSKVPAEDLDGDGVDDNWKPNWNVDGDIYYDTVHPDTNLDTNNDGNPDLNIDTNNDGNPDVNVDKDGDGIPDFNIDVDGDGIPDINIDTDGDWIPDVNVDTTGDWIPNINIDTDGTGEWKPSSEGGNADGIRKPDTSVDTTGDGVGNYTSTVKPVDTDNDGVDDNWNPGINVNVDMDNDGVNDFKYDTGHPDLNLDIDDDGIPDLNIDLDNDGIPDINIDINCDGTPDVNIDLDNDGIPDINIDTDNDGIPDLNIDTDNDGIPDINIDTDNDGIPDLNIDTDNDGIPDVNIDTDNDGIPDLNIDLDDDGIPDLNIDLDNDGIPDLNIDLDNDGIPDLNIDLDNDGIPDLNIDLDNDGIPDLNIDVDGDGIPDLNIDIDGDGIPDLNIDADGNGIIDSEEVEEEQEQESVSTGDDTNVMMYLLMAIMSFVGLLLARRKLNR